MSELDEKTRLYIEKSIDIALTDPNLEAEVKKYLLNMGIDPRLETMLSFITGTVFGSATILWAAKKKADERLAEIPIEATYTFTQNISNLLARRAMELRLHFSMRAHL